MLSRPREGLTGIASVWFIRKNETRSHPRHTQQEPKYRELLRITGQVLESARQVVKKTAKVKVCRRARRRGNRPTPPTDHGVLRPGREGHEPDPSAGTRRRAGSSRRESVLHLRVPHAPDQAGQAAPAGGIRSQGL